MTHQPKGSMCISCGNANASCASRPFASMPVIKTYPDGVKAVKCTGHVHAQASTEKNAALQQVYDATQLEVDRLRGATKMMDPAGEYPPLPRPFIFAHESGGVEWPDTFDATQMRAYADATCDMRAHVGVEQAKRQYYYKVDGCPAKNSDSPDCICWHDEGTGPYAINDSSLMWRDAADAPVMRSAQPAGAQQTTPSAAVALSDDLRDRLVAISEAVADQDDRAAQAMLREILTAPQPSPTPQADSVTAPASGVVVTDDMVLAALRAQYPAAYGQYLRHPANGPKTSLRTESEIDTARRMIVAALSAAPIPPTHAADSVLEDAARLDWLDQQCEAYGFQDIHEGNRWEISGPYANVRVAIDAERAAWLRWT